MAGGRQVRRDREGGVAAPRLRDTVEELVNGRQVQLTRRLRGDSVPDHLEDLRRFRGRRPERIAEPPDRGVPDLREARQVGGGGDGGHVDGVVDLGRDPTEGLAGLLLVAAEQVHVGDQEEGVNGQAGRLEESRGHGPRPGPGGRDIAPAGPLAEEEPDGPHGARVALG